MQQSNCVFDTLFNRGIWAAREIALDQLFQFGSKANFHVASLLPIGTRHNRSAFLLELLNLLRA